MVKNEIRKINSKVEGQRKWSNGLCFVFHILSLFSKALYLCDEINGYTEKRLKGICFIIILGIFSSGIVCNSTYARSEGAPLACLGAGVDKFNVTFAAPSLYTCGSLGCHYQYPMNSGKEKFKLFVVEKCAHGDIVDILVSFEKTSSDFHGFQIAAQDSYYGSRLVGTFINVGDDEDTQVEAGGRFATHTKKGTEQKFWHVKWQAPSPGFFVANPVRFYAMGIEANNDDTPMGDYVYKATRLIVVESKTKKEQIRVIKKKE